MSLMSFQTCMTFIFVHAIQVSEVQKNSWLALYEQKKKKKTKFSKIPYTDQEWYKGE